MAAATFGTTGLDHPTGFITLQLDDGALLSQVSTLSSPQIGVPNPATEPFLDDFRQDLKIAKKEFAHEAAAALKGLTMVLPTHIKAVGKGIATPELAVRTGFGNLRDAPHLMLVPGLLIFITVMSLNLIGDALRDALDPHTSA